MSLHVLLEDLASFSKVNLRTVLGTFLPEVIISTTCGTLHRFAISAWGVLLAASWCSRLELVCDEGAAETLPTSGKLLGKLSSVD